MNFALLLRTIGFIHYFCACHLVDVPYVFFSSSQLAMILLRQS